MRTCAPTVQRRRLVLQADDGIGCRIAGPVGHERLAAVLGAEQPDRPAPQVVLHVRDMQEVLPQHAHAALPHVAAADQEFDVVQCRSGECETLHFRDGHLIGGPMHAFDLEPFGSGRGLQFELSRAGCAHQAVERAAVDHESDVGVIDLCRHQRPHTHHRDGELGKFLQYALRCGHASGCGQRTQCRHHGGPRGAATPRHLLPHPQCRA